MVQKCWVPPVDIDNLSGIASVGVDVSSNGDLIGQPEVVRYVPGQESLSKSLVDALFACSAFKGLPTGEYAAWKKLVINVSKKHTGLYLYDDGAVR